MDGLRIKRLSVPESVENGSSVLLTCDFDLQGETLYSVRWYKNYVEFYRFLPSDVPTPAHSSHLTGAIVDVSFFLLCCACMCLPSRRLWNKERVLSIREQGVRLGA